MNYFDHSSHYESKEGINLIKQYFFNTFCLLGLISFNSMAYPMQINDYL